jgi:selenide,water dikinase
MEDAAIVQTSNGSDVFSTDHLRAFTQDAYLMARLAAIHALGDIWAMGAAPKTVLSHIILPPLSPAKQSAMIQDIMAGAGDVFGACGCEIHGGHTSNGAELTIGFSIQGQTSSAPVQQSGARPGDAIILTKPIGTGVILAAEMRQIADGDDYFAALASMSRLQDKASALLAQSATAMTDVTGFGLAGHMLNILDASEAGAVLNLSKVPLLSGADALSNIGVRSTLWPENAKQGARIEHHNGARGDLLFDPQTCGGLLATVPAKALNDVVSAFHRENEPIWRIGEIVQGDPNIQLA